MPGRRVKGIADKVVVDRTARFTYEGSSVKSIESPKRENKQSVPSKRFGRSYVRTVVKVYLFREQKINGINGTAWIRGSC